MFVTSTIAGTAVVLGLEGYGAQTFAPVREEEDVLVQYVRQNPKTTRTLFAICKWRPQRPIGPFIYAPSSERRYFRRDWLPYIFEVEPLG